MLFFRHIRTHPGIPFPLIRVFFLFALIVTSLSARETDFGPYTRAGSWIYHAHHGWQNWGTAPAGDGHFFDMEFAEAVIEVVWGWRFLPGVQDGENVNTRVRQRVPFVLMDGP